MTSISKNVYIDKLDDKVNKYRNTYHRTIKMEPVDVKPSIYIDFNKDNNKEGPKFNFGENMKISKCFAKCYVPYWPEEVLRLKKLKMLHHGHIFSVILTEKKLLERFTKKSCKKQVKKMLELTK